MLTQVEAVEAALSSLAHPTCRIPFTRDAGAALSAIASESVRGVINLCETVNEDPTLCWHPAAVLELLGIPFSGSPSTALMLTADKVLTKQLLTAAGLRTPGFGVYDRTKAFDAAGLRFPVLVKPRFEDASIGIDQESVFEDPEHLLVALDGFYDSHGPLLVEEYIAGREFNVSVMGHPQPRVLPLAEIEFAAFPKEMYAIVGYRAKWDKDSFEYQNTPRRFPGNLPPALRRGLERTALRCFSLFQVRDYGRVDVRVDGEGRIFVLEVNANPCLSPDAGFAAAYQQSGGSYSRLVDELVACTLQRAAQEGSRKRDRSHAVACEAVVN